MEAANCNIVTESISTPYIYIFIIKAQDSFSLCHLTTPLSILLRHTGTSTGYKLGNENIAVNHLFYMDDLKLYARNAGEIQSLLSTVNIFSTDIGDVLHQQVCPS